MAASPIRVDGQQAPWGVVVATNDQLAHFNADAFPAMRPDIVVKELSGTLALAAAAFARVAALAVPLPDAADPATSGTQSGGFWLSNMIQSLFKPRRAA